MRTLSLLVTIFLAVGLGLYLLDREEKLPEVYTGAAVATTEAPPPRWYAVREPLQVTLRTGEGVRLTVALQLPRKLPGFTRTGETSGRLAQEAVIRAIVSDSVMRHSAAALRSASGRRELERVLRRRIRAHTDVRVRRVALPDVIVG